MKFDFSGYATKNDLQCSDGRIIRKDAFKHNDGATVPLVWQHSHDDPTNVLGHAVLENRADGVYAYCKVNKSQAGSHARELVQHGDISALSIYANNLKQNGGDVLHGAIREVSLVLTGANPGALIDNVSFQHSDGSFDEIPEEAIIYTGEEITMFKETEVVHAAAPAAVKAAPPAAPAANEDPTVQEVFDSLSEEQKNVVYYMIGAALDEATTNNDAALQQAYTDGGEEMKHNIFESKDDIGGGEALSHDAVKSIFSDAQKRGSLKDAVLAHAVTYGIEHIDYLFPDAQSVVNSPDFLKRDMAWVTSVMDGTKHTPFSRIKSIYADISLEDARAKGYVKGNVKKEEFFALAKRTTYPTTIYKKQKLDRDDMLDITDLDVVAWLKAEMRMMLDEELARAVLVGDGRDIASLDKIDEQCIRPIYTDNDLYAHHVKVTAVSDTQDLIDEIIKSRENYKGSGIPAYYTTTGLLTDMLLLKDSLGRRIHNTVADLEATLRVSRIVEVPAMAGLERVVGAETLALKGIMVSLGDYAMGADKGGQIGMFDDFDIDYNQYKYLIETRCSGALIHPKSALVIEQVK